MHETEPKPGWVTERRTGAEAKPGWGVTERRTGSGTKTRMGHGKMDGSGNQNPDGGSRNGTKTGHERKQNPDGVEATGRVAGRCPGGGDPGKRKGGPLPRWGPARFAPVPPPTSD